MKKPDDFEAYLACYPREIQLLLEQVRAAIMHAAPQAEEVISYSMPAFKMNGMLVWIAAHTNHIGFYPGAAGIEAFKKELSGYKGAKGSVQFPYAKPLPLELITRMVKFKVTENLQKINTKKNTKKPSKTALRAKAEQGE